MNKTKWIFYTVIGGALPFILRLLVGLIANHPGNYSFINPSEISFFGLVMCISNINEVEFLRFDYNQIKWVTRTNGISTFFIVLFSSLMVLSLVDEIYLNLFSRTGLQITAALLTLVIFIITCTAYKHLKAYYNE